MKKLELNHYLKLKKEDLEKSFLLLINNNQYAKIKFILQYHDLRGLIDIDCDEGIFLRTACQKGNTRIVNMLLNIDFQGEYPNIAITSRKLTYTSSPLVEATKSGNIRTVKKLLLSRTIANNVVSIEQKHQALSMAIMLGNQSIIKILIDSPKITEPLNLSANYADYIKKCVELYGYGNYMQREKIKNTFIYLIKKYEQLNIKINEINDDFFGSLLSVVALKANKDFLKIIYPFYDNDHAKIEEAIIYCATAKNIDNLEYFLIEEKFKLSEYIKNQMKNSSVEVRSLLEKINLHTVLNNKLHMNDIQVKREKL